MKKLIGMMALLGTSAAVMVAPAMARDRDDWNRGRNDYRYEQTHRKVRHDRDWDGDRDDYRGNAVTYGYNSVNGYGNSYSSNTRNSYNNSYTNNGGRNAYGSNSYNNNRR